MRKFAYRQTIKEQSNNQTDGSKTEATLILCGYSGERANISLYLNVSCMIEYYTLWPVIRYNSFFNRSIGWWGLRVEGYLTLHNRRVGWVYCIYSFILYLYIFRVSLREDVRRVKEEWRIPGSAWAACSEGERHRGA